MTEGIERRGGYTGTIGRHPKYRTSIKLERKSQKLFSSYSRLQLMGATALSGSQYIMFSLGRENSAWLTKVECARPPSAVCELLCAAGVHLFGKAGADAVSNQLPNIRDFPLQSLIDQPGWTPPYFTLTDGTIVAPTDAPEVTSIFRSMRGALRHEGRPKQALAVARMVTGQPVLMFVACAALAAVAANILRSSLMIGFELVAPQGSPVSAVMKYGASIGGSMGHDPMPYHAFRSDMTAAIDAARGSLMLIGDPELSLAGERPAQVGAAIRDVIASLAGDGGPTCAFIIAGSQSLVDRVGEESELGVAIRRRLITISVGAEGRPELFRKLGGQSASEFADLLVRQAAGSEGVTLGVFVKQFVQAIADDEDVLRECVQSWVREFRMRSGVNLDDVAAVREVDTFGFIYAVGRLARHYGALPKEWKIGRSVLRIFRDYRVAPPPPRPIGELLEELASRPDTVHRRSGQPVSDEAIDAADIIVKYATDGRSLLVTPTGMAGLPELRGRLQETSVRARMTSAKAEKHRLKFGKKPSPNRAYRFKMDPEGPVSV